MNISEVSVDPRAYTLPDLLAECHHILQTDAEDYAKQLRILEKLKANQEHNATRLLKFEQRLLNARIRNNFFSEVITRMNRVEFQLLYLALEQILAETEQRHISKETSCKTRFLITLDENGAEYLIINP